MLNDNNLKIMEYTVSDKIIDVSEKVVIRAFEREYIDDNAIKDYCKSEGVNYNQVFVLTRPYLNATEERFTAGQIMRYEINNKGSKFIMSGMYERERLKRRIDELSAQNIELQTEKLQNDKDIRCWKKVSLILGIISLTLTAIVSVIGVLQLII